MTAEDPGMRLTGECIHAACRNDMEGVRDALIELTGLGDRHVFFAMCGWASVIAGISGLEVAAGDAMWVLQRRVPMAPTETFVFQFLAAWLNSDKDMCAALFGALTNGGSPQELGAALGTFLCVVRDTCRHATRELS